MTSGYLGLSGIKGMKESIGFSGGLTSGAYGVCSEG